MKSRLKITHLSTGDLDGGAFRAAYRLHQGLNDLGLRSKMAVLNKVSYDPRVVMVDPENHRARATQAALFQYVQTNRTPLSDCILTLPYPGFAPDQLKAVRGADVLNLHWVANFLTPQDIGRLLDLGKPVVWRLSDQWPFCGTCHYSAGCFRYRQDCSECPQIESSWHGVVAELFAQKRLACQDADLTVVSPSRWLAAMAKESVIFAGKDIRVIPNGLDTDEFCPGGGARARLGIPEEALVALFVAVSFDRRKGIEDMEGAVGLCLSDPVLAKVHERGLLRFICVGTQKYPLSDQTLPMEFTGAISENRILRDYYCAADVFVTASREENFPSTVLEAMSCGTPVVGVNSGGIPDQIVHSETGLVCPVADAHALSRAIATIFKDKSLREGFGRQARARAVAEFSLERMAANYRNLYLELASRPARKRPSQDIGPEASAGFARKALDWLEHEAMRLAQDVSGFDSIWPCLNAVNQLLGVGRCRSGLAILEALPPQARGQLEVMRSKGVLLARMKRFDEAFLAFDAALALSPDRADLLMNKSDCLREAGDFAAAQAILERVEASNPEQGTLWFKRAQILQAAGAHKQAVAFFARAYREKSHPLARYRLSQAAAIAREAARIGKDVSGKG